VELNDCGAAAGAAVQAAALHVGSCACCHIMIAVSCLADLCRVVVLLQVLPYELLQGATTTVQTNMPADLCRRVVLLQVLP
jgi:hypothetical protein